MRYTKGNIWELWDEQDAWIVVPINMSVRKDGKAVMGADMAFEAAQRFPELPKSVADFHSYMECPLTYQYQRMFCIATKKTWRAKTSLKLVEQACKELESLSTLLYDVGNNDDILVPVFGDDIGWERKVRPAIDSILSNRFVLVNND